VQVVFDSVTLNHLLRPPKASSKARRPTSTRENLLEGWIRLQKITFAIDFPRALVDEWQKTCGPDIKVLVAHWGEIKRIIFIKNLRNPPQPTARRLRNLGFGNDTGDKLVLRIAMGTDDRTIVSDDSDFWDPSDSRAKGNPKAPVAKLCKDELNVTILLLNMLMDILK
jgi:hypothetical protein